MAKRSWLKERIINLTNLMLQWRKGRRTDDGLILGSSPNGILTWDT